MSLARLIGSRRAGRRWPVVASGCVPVRSRLDAAEELGVVGQRRGGDAGLGEGGVDVAVDAGPASVAGGAGRLPVLDDGGGVERVRLAGRAGSVSDRSLRGLRCERRHGRDDGDGFEIGRAGSVSDRSRRRGREREDADEQGDDAGAARATAAGSQRRPVDAIGSGPNGS